jgi:hypothetical protein
VDSSADKSSNTTSLAILSSASLAQNVANPLELLGFTILAKVFPIFYFKNNII